MAIERHALNDHNFGELVSHRVTETGRSPHREYGIAYTYERGEIHAKIGKNGFYTYEAVDSYVESMKLAYPDCPF